eukprot:TRINITY_DN4161_c0_g1_i1.p1 TRINITY_DN4161_c0_g1~~TRINITY_DN4161_c0_g1_i1.p1  ORF type:complete len:117 (+),score=58.05 TRINITY_DN4161_c0_g1_i1:142-492(+)
MSSSSSAPKAAPKAASSTPKASAFPDGLVIFYASVSGTQKTKKDTQSLQWLLEKKRYDFQLIDVARNEIARGLMTKKSKTRVLPQLFVSGHFIGTFDEVQAMEEEEKLDELLSDLL